MEAWAGEDKTVSMCVKPGSESYAGELLRFMHTRKVSYSLGMIVLLRESYIFCS